VIRPLIALLVSACLVNAAEEDWRSKLTPPRPGPFPELRALRATYGFGWSEIEAAHADIEIGPDGPFFQTRVSGGTQGVARALWKLDAKCRSTTERDTLRPVVTQQSENYSRKKVDIQIVSRPDGLWYRRAVDPQGEHAPKWKLLHLEPVFDLVSGMLFIRSQKLADGDEVTAIIFPGDSPFLVTAKVAGRESISVAGQKRPAIRLDLSILRIGTKGDEKGKLLPHKKFRSGRVWISDDRDRMALRAEVEIFIGYVYGELKEIHFADDPAPAKKPPR